MAAAEEPGSIEDASDPDSMEEYERGIIDSLRGLLNNLKIPKMSDNLDKTSTITSNNYDDFGDLMKEIAETLLPDKCNEVVVYITTHGKFSNTGEHGQRMTRSGAKRLRKTLNLEIDIREEYSNMVVSKYDLASIGETAYLLEEGAKIALNILTSTVNKETSNKIISARNKILKYYEEIARKTKKKNKKKEIHRLKKLIPGIPIYDSQKESSSALLNKELTWVEQELDDLSNINPTVLDNIYFILVMEDGTIPKYFRLIDIFKLIESKLPEGEKGTYIEQNERHMDDMIFKLNKVYLKTILDFINIIKELREENYPIDIKIFDATCSYDNGASLMVYMVI